MTSAAFAAVRFTSAPEIGTSTMSTSPSRSRSAAGSSCPRSPRWQTTRSSRRIAKTVFRPRAVPFSSSWNAPMPVTSTSRISYSPGPRRTTGSPPTLLRLECPGCSCEIVTIAASVFGMACPDLGSGGSVSTTPSRPRMRKHAWPSQVRSMKWAENTRNTAPDHRVERVTGRGPGRATEARLTVTDQDVVRACLAGDAEAYALRREELGEVVAAMAELPPAYRAALTLRHMQQLSYQEVADALGIPLGTVKTHLHRARAALKVRLAARLKGRSV